MAKLTTEEVSKLVQRKLGLVVFPAVLGDENGVVYDDPAARNGLVRVRYTTAAGLSLPPVVRMKAVLPPNPGTSVLVGYDKQGELAVLEGDYAGMLAQGVNPLVMNAADPNVYGYTNQISITTALSHAISTPNVASTDVAVRAWIYVEDDVWHYFAGERVALASFIPAAGLQCLVGLYLKTDDTIEAFASTDKDLLDPLGIADIQEIHDQITTGSKPVWFWRLHDAQTRITDADSFLDGRQFINAVTDSSASGGSLIDADTYIVDDADPTKRIQFQVSPVTAGQTRVITVKDANLTMVGEDTVQAISGKTDISIRDDSAQPVLLIESQTDTSADYPLITLKHSDASSGDLEAFETIGKLEFRGRANGLSVTGSVIHSQHSGTPTQHHAELIFLTTPGLSDTEFLRLSGLNAEVVVNGSGNAIDFRVESANLTHAIFVDASADGIAINGTSVAATALLDIQSTTKGVLIPRMTTAQRDAIATPADGLMVYDTDVDAPSQFQNGAWTYLVSLNGTQTLTNKSISASQINSGTLLHERGGLEADVSAYDGLVGITGGATAAYPFNRHIVQLRDEQAQNTAGGGFTSGAWQTRVLNTESIDTGGLCTLSSNQFVLAAGTYQIRASAPAHQCNGHQTRLQNATAATTTITGTTERAPAGAGVMTRSIVEGRFTSNGTDAYELQHRCGTTRATDGLGIAANLTTEVYAQVWLIKER